MFNWLVKNQQNPYVLKGLQIWIAVLAFHLALFAGYGFYITVLCTLLYYVVFWLVYINEHYKLYAMYFTSLLLFIVCTLSISIFTVTFDLIILNPLLSFLTGFSIAYFCVCGKFNKIDEVNSKW